MAWFAMSFVMRSGNKSMCSMDFDNMAEAYSFVMNAIDKGTSIVSVSKENSLVINGRDISSVLITPRG